MSNDTLDQQLKQNGSLETKSNAIKFGIIAGFVTVLSSLVLYFTDQEYNPLLSFIPTILSFIVIILAQQQTVKANNNFIFEFKSLFNIGFKIALIMSIFTLLYYLIYCNFLEPNFVDKMSEISREKLVERNMSEEQIEAALEMSSKFTTPITTPIFKFIFAIIIGTIASLIGAAIFKNEK